MTAARRLAAILAADVVGYSRLMGGDEAGTARPCGALAAIDRFRAISYKQRVY
jgi:class 3 adenylate cyclase